MAVVGRVYAALRYAAKLSVTFIGDNVKDQILKGYVEAFSNSFEIAEPDDSVVFEHFVNFCVTAKQYPRDFDYDTLHVGGSDDIGLDGAAFIVNGNIITTPEEIGYLAERDGFLDVRFILIQTKKSSSFKGDQVGTLIFGVKSFFDDSPSIPENESVRELRSIKDKVYENILYLRDAPTLDIYFVTTGEWKEPDQITGRVSRELRDLESQKLFSSIEFVFYDAEKLKQAYREINRKTIKEIRFDNHVSLPEIPGVRQTFVGSISAKEYISLISDSDGNLQKNLFEDNVRDYQGSNKVNRDIKKTLTSSSEQAALPVFHNGITIISRKVEPIGKKMKLTDFQVVNGCQSSHVLYEAKNSLLEDTHIIVKIIETTDYEFATKVVKATNRQTEVKDEAFESLSQFHRDLEEFYKAKAKSIANPIYYERRSKQYEGDASVKSAQVVNLSTQISSFVAGQLVQPQSTHRYYGELLESNSSRMFKDGDRLEPYYISALILKRLESAFKSRKLDSGYKSFKYHLVYVLFQFYKTLKDVRSDYSYDQIIDDLSKNDQYLKVANAGIEVIKTLMGEDDISKHEAVRSKSFTSRLRDNLESQFPRRENVTRKSRGRRKARR